LRLIPDDELTRRTLLRGVREGQLVVRLPDSRSYDNGGAVEGSPGTRRRAAGSALNALALDDATLIALPTAPAAAGWLAVDTLPIPGGQGGGTPTPPPPPPPPPAGDLTTGNLANAIDASASRPLTQLIITARTPADAKLLTQIAQPFGASSISLAVSVVGDVKGGGTIALSVEAVKHNHPLKPLDIASAIANSLTDSTSFEASLTLDFDTGLLMAGSHLQTLAERGDALRVSCRFGPSAGGGA
jgi:hypothetical protein